MLLYILLNVYGLIWIFVAISLVFRRFVLRKKLAKQYKLTEPPLILAFFHPYCNSGGGGERVLWTGVNAILRSRPSNILIFIYTNDRMCLNDPARVFQRVRETFDISIVDQSRITFVPLTTEVLLRASIYPALTLLGQAAGSVVVGFEALLRLPPDVFIDTTGFAFTIPLFYWLLGTRCGAYVHFPTISSDMVKRVISRSAKTSYNNSDKIRNSAFLTTLKGIYYTVFKWIYGWVGSRVNTTAVAVNSSWTLAHINSLFGTRPELIYPPCPCKVVDKPGDKRKPWIISIGQFRPEKNHMLQLKVFHRFLQCIPEDKGAYRLVLIGGCRDDADRLRVRRLQEAVRRMGLPEHQVLFEVNAPSDKVKLYLSEASINLHTMIDEHFGIGIVEGMAAGLVTVAHRSGGPKTDIIGPAMAQPLVDPSTTPPPTPVGYLAATEEEYARVLLYVLTEASAAQLQPLRDAARLRALALFSEEAFARHWLLFMQRFGI